MEIGDVVATGVVSTLTKAAGKKMLDVASQTLNDYRERNAPAYWTKFNSMVNPLGLEEPREVPPKIWYPIIDHGTLEDDDFLRTKYAALLANAIDPTFKYEVRPSFVEILKQLTPTEARLLDAMYDYAAAHPGKNYIPGREWLTIIDRLAISDEVDLVLPSLFRHWVLAPWMPRPAYGGPELNSEDPKAAFTNFGSAFVAACRPPVVQ